MNFIYDIYLNFNDILYEFYDWNKKDKIIHIKRIPLFKVNSKTLRDIVSKKIKLSSSFLSLIENKTIIYGREKQICACVFTDSDNVVAVMFNLDSLESTKKSYFLVEEELDILDISVRMDEYSIKYTIVSEDVPFLKTRKEALEYKFLLKELDNIDSDLLKYLYFECFSKEENDYKRAFKRIKELLNNSNSLEYRKLYNLLSLIKNT